MIAILSTVVGALIRYVPNLFGFMGDWFKTKQEVQQEQALLQLNIELEKAKAAGAVQVAQVSAEQSLALANIQAAVEELKSGALDRQSARAFGNTIHTSLVSVLQTGVTLGVNKVVLAFGWFLVLCVESFAAAVQPGIAAAGFAMWMGWKVSLFLTAKAATDAVVPALLATWTESDWMLIDTILGFFLAGRAIKYGDTRK